MAGRCCEPDKSVPTCFFPGREQLQWEMTIDAAAAALLISAVTLLFAFSVSHKIRSPQHFAAVLADYQIMPDGLVPAASWVVISAELAVVGLVLLGQAAAALMLAGLLMAGYTFGIALNLLRGRRDIDCGCAGPAASQTLSGWLLLRNVLLLTVIAVALVPGQGRTLGWFDWLTVTLGLAAAAALYSAANTLIASHLRLTTNTEARLWKTR